MISAKTTTTKKVVPWALALRLVVFTVPSLLLTVVAFVKWALGVGVRTLESIEEYGIELLKKSSSKFPPTFKKTTHI
jgi:hypothetical protein